MDNYSFPCRFLLNMIGDVTEDFDSTKCTLPKTVTFGVNSVLAHVSNGAKRDHQLCRVYQILNNHNKIFVIAVECLCLSEHLHRPV